MSQNSPAPADADGIGRFNLSAWSLRHRSLIGFLMVLLLAAGAMSYMQLGRAEDPDFTFKVMIVRTNWPGATAREVEQLVTDKIEKKLQETPYLDNVRSYSKAAESTIFIALRDSTPPKAVSGVWYEVRKKVGDIRHTLPAGVQGPFFNDEFGDTFGTIYAFTADGFTHRELKDYVEDVREELLRIKDVGKADLLGVQPERVFIEFSNKKLANLGISPQQVIDVIQAQNAQTASGVVQTSSDRIATRVSGEIEGRALGELSIQANGRLIRLGDIADIKRDYADPPSPRLRYNGQDSIGLAVSMAKGGNMIELGKQLDATMKRLKADMPIGIEVLQVADQPTVVQRSISEFMQVLLEAVVIVLGVSFLSLGLRSGMVVMLCIPLVLAITFVCMQIFGIDFHRISLGALIISLGLLVDDAIIAVEMMQVKMEQGFDRFRAASFAYTSTAFPMLTGTLITAAGFVPVGFAKSSAGEYTFSIFAVVTISLLVSWIVAVIFTPFIGYTILPTPKAGHGHGEDVYHRGIYRYVRPVVEWCVRRRWIVIASTIVIFVASVGGFGLVQQQFFPSSNRPELMVDLRLPQGASIQATEQEALKLEALLKDDKDIVSYTTYVGAGAPRFYLPLDIQLPNDNFAQVVVLTKGDAERERVREKLVKAFQDDFILLRGRVNRLENGPPVGFPVQFRVSGPDPMEVRRIAFQVADVMRTNPNTRDVNLDWNELSKVVKLDVDQAKARLLGISSQDLATMLNSIVSGVTVTQYREGRELIDVVARAEASERLSLTGIRDLNVAGAESSRAVPLGQVAEVSYELEEGIIWRRDRQPVITVRADIIDGIQAPVVSMQIEPKLDELRKRLPPNYRVVLGGAIEESAKANASIGAVVPVMIMIMVTLLMVQLQSVSRMLLVLLTAPLGLIGVTVGLLVFNVPFGFVAMLGAIALAGMIMRNSVILVDQIEQDIAGGEAVWDAIVNATLRRFRPIILTALAAILGMIPLSTSNFWGPMAYTIIGGLLVATLLTVLFLPALYAAWFRVKRPAAA
ncbi:efflux RND transporter permease subunit [Ferrovibrio terrae]|uniref:Efflux RND transporter permease subunit n=1 Tax=Ferrovibrio terrae TaxID=2594003 RepID=A0A516H294_9PROT|nr:efflux RND transporter permease subunit [Ferrovibrio terrae]QDO97896.1 efflux RND transporter permease subunit [Ferrovibrio terrae]